MTYPSDQQEPKWIVKSKTTIAAALSVPVASGAAWLLTKTGFDIDAPTQAAIVAGATATIIGVLNIVLRRFTSQAVTFLKPPAPPA